MSCMDEPEIRGVLNRASNHLWKDEPRLLVLVRRVISYIDNERVLAERERDQLRVIVESLRPPDRALYLYCMLPAITRIEIAARLELYEPELQMARSVFARAKQVGKLDELIAAINDASAKNNSEVG
jgi:hypothetical protein